MAKGLDEKINSMETSWSGYTGARVEEFIKETLNKRVGFVGEDAGFAYFYPTKEAFDNDSGRTYALGSIYTESPYILKAKFDENNKKVFLSNDNNKKLIWYFKTVYNGSESDVYSEGISVEYNITNNNTVIYNTVIENAKDGPDGYRMVELDLDTLLDNGDSSIKIFIKGLRSKQEAIIETNVSIVMLDMNDNTNFGSIFENNLIIKSDVICTIGQSFHLSYRIDEGEFIFNESYNKNGTGRKTSFEYQIPLDGYSDGKHVFEYRLFVNVGASNEPYYTKINRIEFIKKKSDEPEILIYASYNDGDDIEKEGNLLINDAYQYTPYSLKYSVFNPNSEITNIAFYEVNDSEKVILSTNKTNNGQIYNFNIQSIKTGDKKIEVYIGGESEQEYTEIIRSFVMYFIESQLLIDVYNDNLRIDFNSVGKNNISNRDVWESIVKIPGVGEYKNNAFFNKEFDWSKGWTENGLVISEGSKVSFDYIPFPIHRNGANEEEKKEFVGGSNAYTFEIEFMTQNVTNENAVVCSMIDELDGKCGLQITGSEIKFTTPAGNSVSTRFKAEEMNRATIVIRPYLNDKNEFSKGLIELYVNGVLSNINKYTSLDNFVVRESVINENGDKTYQSKPLTFNGSSGADIVVKYVRAYNGAMDSDDVVNNYVLYRTDSSQMLNLYNKNNVINSNGVVTTDALLALANIPILIFVGRTNESELAVGENLSIDAKSTNHYGTLEDTTNKKESVEMDVIYYNPMDKSKNFKFVKSYITPQGTSSMYYPKKNYRIYTQKTDTRMFLSKDNDFLELNDMLISNFGDREGDEKYETFRGQKKKKLYAFKNYKTDKTNSQPVKCWCLKADFAETSSSHNTGIARLWNDTLKNSKVDISGSTYSVFKTKAQATIEEKYKNNKDLGLDKMPDIRTTVDGFPIVVFGKKSYADDLVFLGQYNFNNDKSTESVFGFCDIDKEYKITYNTLNNNTNEKGSSACTIDDQLDKYMTCVETLDNGNDLGNFAVMNTEEVKWDNVWDKAFEFRYPEIPEKPKETDYKENGAWKEGGEEEYNEALAEYEKDLERWSNRHLKPFKHFAQWVYDTRWCDVNGNILVDELQEILNSDVELINESGETISTVQELAEFRQRKFATEKWEHLDVWKVAAYYIYAMRFGAVDQIVKNSMLTSEGPFAYDKSGSEYGYWDSTSEESNEYGKYYKWYYINYDNDTIMGVKNDGRLVYGPDITRTMKEGEGENATYIYAGYNSTLWNNLDYDSEFQGIVITADKGISNTMRYADAIDMFDNKQVGQWCERLYNKDAEYKYINPYISDWVYSGTTEENFSDKLFMLQGSRTAHRRWWLSRRFNLFDGKWSSGDYSKKHIDIKCNGLSAGTFSAQAATNGYFGYQINNQTGGSLKYGDTGEYKAGDIIDWALWKTIQIGDPIAIYGAGDILKLDVQGLSSTLSEISFTFGDENDNANKLEELILSVPEDEISKQSWNEFCESVTLDKLLKLQTFKMAGYKGINSLNLNNNPYIKNVDIRYSSIGNVLFSEGASIKEFYASDALTDLTFTRCNQIKMNNIKINDTLLKDDGGKNIKNITINYSEGLNHSNDFKDFILNWIKDTPSEKSLTLNGLKWLVNLEDLQSLIDFKTQSQGCTLSGEFEIYGNEVITKEGVDLINNFNSEEVFNNSVNIIIKNATIFIESEKDAIVAGESLTFTRNVYPNEDILYSASGIVKFYVVKRVDENDIHDFEVDGVCYKDMNNNLDEIRKGLKITTYNDDKSPVASQLSCKIESKEEILGENHELTIMTSLVIIGKNTRYSFKTITINDPTYAVSARIVNEKGEEPLKSLYKSTSYKFRVDIKDKNGKTPNASFDVKWSTNDSEELFISKDGIVPDEKDKCLMTLTTKDNQPEVSSPLVITCKITNGVDGIELEGYEKYIATTLSAMVLNENVIISSESNPIVLDICRKAEWITSDAVAMTKDDALKVSSIETHFAGVKENFSFEEFRYFTNVTNLEVGAFANSKLTNIILPNSIKEIGNSAFENCKVLNSVKTEIENKVKNILPSEITNIPEKCFLNCVKLKQLRLSSTIEEIKNFAFGGTTFKNAIVEDDNYLLQDGDLVLNENLQYIHDYAFEVNSWNNNIPEITYLNNSIETSNVTNPLEKFVIGKNLEFHERAQRKLWLYGLNYKTFEVKDNQRYVVENNALYNAGGETLYRIAPNSNNFELDDNGETFVKLNANCITVDKYAFMGAQYLDNVIANGQLANIGEYAFAYNEIKNIDLSACSNLTKLPNYCFYNARGLEHISLPENNVNFTSFGTNLFVNCTNLMEINIPETITTFEGDDARSDTFLNCGFSALTIPDSVESPKARYIINNCNNLKVLKLPAFWKLDKYQVITENPNLTDVYLPIFSYTNDEGENVIYQTEMNKSNTYVAPSCTSLTRYHTHERDNKKVIKSDDDGVLYKVDDNGNLLEVYLAPYNIEGYEFPEGIKYIGNDAFKNCSKLIDLKIPSTIEGIGDSAFRETGIREFVLPVNVNKVPKDVCWACNNLEKVVLHENVDEIGSFAFISCNNLKTIISYANTAPAINGDGELADLETIITIGDNKISATPGIYIDGVRTYAYVNNPFGYRSGNMVGTNVKKDKTLYISYDSDSSYLKTRVKNGQDVLVYKIYKQKGDNKEYVYFTHQEDWADKIVQKLNGNNDGFTYDYDEENAMGPWVTPLLSAAGFTLKYIEVDNKSILNVYDFNGNEITDAVWFTSESGDLNYARGTAGAEYNEEENGFIFNTSIGTVYENEIIKVYANSECTEYLGEFKIKQNVNKYTINQPSQVYGFSRSMDLFNTSLVNAPEIEETPKEVEMANITKKDYDKLLLRINQLTEIIKKIK